MTTPKTPARIRALPVYEPIRQFNEAGEREYVTPNGIAAGVTTILAGSRDNSGLERWRESIGVERADAIRDLAAHRGTFMHASIERYLTDHTEPEFSFLHSKYWNSIRPFLSNIDTVLAMESAVYHPLNFAGTFDCIAYLTEDGDQPTLLDWKSADKVRTPDKMYEYSLQVSAYAAAANYVYSNFGLNIKQAKIVVAIPCQPPQVETLDERALSQLFKHFEARLKRFTYARSRRTPS